jgi:molybdopterin/thiamine biosynthesis adenylyltransferase
VGVGRIVCVDRDTFDETNLNRQLLATGSTLGMSKSSQAHERVKEINEAVEVVAVTTALAEVAPGLWRDVDVVFDCLDNVPDRRALAETCSTQRIPLVHGAVGAWCGQVGVIWPHSGALERLYRNCRDVERTGVLPFTAAIAASLMVSDGVKVLVGKRDDTELRFLFFDLQENEWHNVAFGNGDSDASFEREGASS